LSAAGAAKARRIVFAGTPEFARVALAQLHAAGHQVVRVLTQPDRPAGRGMQLHASVVKQFAVQHQIPVLQPRSLRLDGKFPQDAHAARLALEADAADLMVVAAYGLILPQWVLDLFAPDAARTRLGCLNIHASLLPRWRGAAPIHRAIEAGDEFTGVCIMQMDAGLDTGDVLLRQAQRIGAQDSTASLHDTLANLGAALLLQALAADALVPVPQPDAGVCYAHKLEKHEAALDWRCDAALLERRIRAFDPFPGASASLGGGVFKVWRAQCADASSAASAAQPAAPGTILQVGPQGVDVACGSGVLRLLELQRAGAKRLPVAEFLRGNALEPGQVLAAPTLQSAHHASQG